MIGIAIVYVLFLIGGFWMLKRRHSIRREKVVFFSLTTIGFLLWVSLLLHRPLDMNRAIAYSIDYLFGLKSSYPN
jgi:hypothetical protein